MLKFYNLIKVGYGKIISDYFTFLYSSSFIIYSQEVTNERNYHETPNYFIPKNHDPNFLKLNKLPSKSFYESKSDWQYIVDTTWGPGDPLPQKLLLFNTYAPKIRDQFDGFLLLQLNWDSLYLYYLDQINDSTSKVAFSAIMRHFSYSPKDLHTRAVDTTTLVLQVVPNHPLNLEPGDIFIGTGETGIYRSTNAYPVILLTTRSSDMGKLEGL